MSMPDFVQYGQLTPEGQKVVDHIEGVIDEALAACDGQNITPLNEMAGVYQEFYAMVKSTGAVKLEDWVKSRSYPTGQIWGRIVEAEKQAERAEKAEAQQGQLDERLAKLEEQLAAVLQENAALKAQVSVTEDENAATEEEADEPEAEKKLAPKRRRRKTQTQDTEGQEAPAETNAEGEPAQEE